MTDNRYPKAKYHVDGSHCVVRSQEDDDAQDPRVWFDHPDKAKAGPPPEPPKPRGRPPKVEKAEEEPKYSWSARLVEHDGK